MDEKKVICFELKNLDNLIKKRAQKSFCIANDSVTRMHGWLIGYLYNNQGRDIYQKDIEVEFKISRSTVSGILKTMEKNGLVQRVAVDNDARLKKILLTQKAMDIHNDVEKRLVQTEKLLRKDLSNEDVENFFRIINKMKDNIQKGGKND